MKFYLENEAIDKVIGGKGTQSRMEFEAQMNDLLTNLLTDAKEDSYYSRDADVCRPHLAVR